MTFLRPTILVTALFLLPLTVFAGQSPAGTDAPDIPISHSDRVYAGEQFSNTVSVTDPASNTLLGVLRLGDPQPGNFSPLYKGQVLVHGMGFSPDQKRLYTANGVSNDITVIDVADQKAVKSVPVGRSPWGVVAAP